MNHNSPTNILIVDDQPQNLIVLEAILAPLKQNLVFARSGPEALRHVLVTDFALVLLDVQMPVMDGFETARTMRQREKARTIPIIFVTAINKDDRYISEGYAAGAVDYIFKPFEPEVLKSKVSIFVELYQQRQRVERQGLELRLAELREAKLAFRKREQLRRLKDANASTAKQLALLQDVLASVTGGKLRLCVRPSELPKPLSSFGRPVALAPAAVQNMRRLAQEAAVACNFSCERSHDLLTAVSEAVTNAVVHGGEGKARVCVNDAGTLQVWIQDNGSGIDLQELPRATLERGFTTAGTLGHGFWLMLQTVDRLWLQSKASGTTVVLELDRIPPEPHWQRK
jgi:CheY-like chemotaxis protein